MRIKNAVKSILHKIHDHKKTDPDVYIISLPRSGSTLLAEVLNTSSDSKLVSEPFALNVNNRVQLTKYFDASFLSERYVDLSNEEFKVINTYFKDLSSGKTWNAYYWTDFFTKYHSYSTNRTIFKTHKITYHFDDLMRHFRDDFGLYLIRHPVSHSLSRLRLGWANYINLFSQSEKIRDRLSPEANSKIKEIDSGGSDLEKLIVSWCLENYIFIHLYQKNELPDNLLPVFYEDLVLEPEMTLKKICCKLKMDFNSDMVELVNVPSSGIVHSRKETAKQILKGEKDLLLNRWRVDQMDLSDKRLTEILEIFGIEIYL